MKQLNLKDEATIELLDELEINGYTETITNGEEASWNKRHTFYDCERLYNLNGKQYKAVWSCASNFNGKEAYNDLEQVHELYEI